MADMKFVISATDHASAVIGSVGKSVDSLDAKTRKMRAAAGMLSAGAIIAFGASSVKAYAEAEAQQVKLQEAYRKFPAIASVSIDSMRQLNSAIQAKTGSDDDELAAAEAKLAMYNLTGQQIQQLIPLVNDYAVATGTSTVDAAQTLGKAMMGNARALKALGIDFKATGDRTKDFQAIYDALNQKVGGAGEAFGQTTAGQVKILQQSFSDLQEEVGAQLVPALKTVVSIAKPVIGAFGALPGPVKSATVIVAGLGAAALLVGPRLLAMRAAMIEAGAAGGVMGRGIGLASKAFLAYAIALTASSAMTKDASLNTEGLAAALDDMAKSGQAAGVATTFFGEQGSILQENLKWATGTGLGGFDKVTYGLGAVEGAIGITATTAGNAREQFANLDAYLSQLAGSNPKAAAAALDYVRQNASNLGIGLDEVNRLLPNTVTALDGVGPAAANAAGQIDELTSSTANGVDKAKLATDTMNGLKAALDALGGKAISVNDATAGLEDSYDKAATTAKELTQKQGELGAAVTKGGASLDLSTEAGRKAHDALKDIATSADSAAVAYSAAGMSSDEIAKKTTEARAEFIKSARQMGLSASAAESLADSYGLIPGEVKTTITNNAASAVRQAVINYIATLNSIPEERRTQIITEYITEGSKPTRPVMGPGTVKAGGGYVSGAGTSTSDSIPAMLSNGEYVIRASSVQRLGLGLLDDLNDDGRSTRLRFARGGPVTIDARTGKLLTADQIKARNELVANYSSRAAGFASLSGAWDTKAYGEALKERADATQKVADATTALADAERRATFARTPEDRASALKDQADAEKALAAAKQERASAETAVARSKPTVSNMIGALRAKVGQLKTFSVNLRRLAQAGLPPSILKDLIDAGPGDGGDIAAALVAAKPADIKELLSLQRQMDTYAGRVGVAGANAEKGFREYTPGARARMASSGGSEPIQVTTVVNLDGKQIATALAQYKKSIGGRSLGLG